MNDADPDVSETEPSERETARKDRDRARRGGAPQEQVERAVVTPPETRVERR